MRILALFLTVESGQGAERTSWEKCMKLHSLPRVKPLTYFYRQQKNVTALSVKKSIH